MKVIHIVLYFFFCYITSNIYQMEKKSVIKGKGPGVNTEFSSPIAQAVYKELEKQPQPVTAATLWKTPSLKSYTRKEINHALYEDLRNVVCRTEGPEPAPLWSVKNGCNKVQAEKEYIDESGCTYMIVVIDLGNVHDCLEKCVKYKAHDMIHRVIAVADSGFQGYGVKPKVEGDGIVVHRIQQSGKGNGEVELIWRIQEECAENNPDHRRIHFLLATRSEGLGYLSHLVSEYGHVLHFVKNANELAEYVE